MHGANRGYNWEDILDKLLFSDRLKYIWHFCCHSVILRRHRRCRRDRLAALKQAAGLQMNWIILIIAGLCEVGFTYCLGRARTVEGLEWWAWMGGFVVVSLMSMVLLAKATQTLPLGTAYPVWTGIGAVGTVLVGIFVFHEPATFWRLFFITTLIASIIGLKALS